MERVATVGLDIAKSVFQVHGIDATGAVVVRRKLARGRVLTFFEALPRCQIGTVLCPMNRGVLGARNLNHELQRVLNPNPTATVERFGWRSSPGDRVMETQNDYDREVFNGDLGTVARIDEHEGAVVVDFEGREVVYPYGELDTLVP